MTSAVSSRLFVFCPPPPGKPNPAQPKPEGADLRDRVIQHGSKDNTCWYYVFNFLRDHYKAPNTEDLPQRRFEVIASSRRKALSAHERTLPDLADQLNAGPVKRMFSIITKSSITTPPVTELIRSLDEADPNPKYIPISSAIPGFLTQTECENFYDYLSFLKFSRRAEINLKFFSELGFNLEEFFQEQVALDPAAYCGSYHFAPGTKFSELPPPSRITLLDILARLASAKLYGLTLSSWSPRHPFEHLVEELRKCSPLSIVGSFGRPHYQEPAKNLGRSIEGRALYGWKKSDPKIEAHITGHAILLVGAEKLGDRDFVYYIDPMDDSDPAHPENQPIYAMSYERLISADTICDFHGFVRISAPPQIGYAVYKRS